MKLNLKLAIGIFTLNVFDLITTIYGLSIDGIYESNPYSNIITLIGKTLLSTYFIFLARNTSKVTIVNYHKFLTGLFIVLIIFYSCVVGNNIIQIIGALSYA